MKRLSIVAALMIPLGVLAADAPKAKDAKATAAPSVNWEGQVLKATGSGAPDMKASSPAQARLGAEKAAQMDAFRNLLSQAKGIQISAGKTVGDEMAKDEVKGRVEGAIRGYKVTGKRYFSDQGVELDVEVPLSALSAVVGIEPATQQGVKTDGEKKNTGLLVDARGLKVTPALSPRILDEAGKSIYGIDCLSEDARKSKGAASYFATLEAAKKSMLVGDKPLLVKPSKVNGTDFILGADDVKKLADENNSYLAEGRVAIVTN